METSQSVGCGVTGGGQEVSDGESQVSGSPRLMSHKLFTFTRFKAFDLLPGAPRTKKAATPPRHCTNRRSVRARVCVCAMQEQGIHLGVLEKGVLLDALNEHELVVAVPRPVQQVLHQVLMVLEDSLWWREE